VAAKSRPAGAQTQPLTAPSWPLPPPKRTSASKRSQQQQQQVRGSNERPARGANARSRIPRQVCGGRRQAGPHGDPVVAAIAATPQSSRGRGRVALSFICVAGPRLPGAQPVLLGHLQILSRRWMRRTPYTENESHDAHLDDDQWTTASSGRGKSLTHTHTTHTPTAPTTQSRTHTTLADARQKPLCLPRPTRRLLSQIDPPLDGACSHDRDLLLLLLLLLPDDAPRGNATPRAARHHRPRRSCNNRLAPPCAPSQTWRCLRGWRSRAGAECRPCRWTSRRPARRTR
jgi:hypothetical protein